MAHNEYSSSNRDLRMADSGDSMFDERLLKKFSYYSIVTNTSGVDPHIDIKELSMYYRPESTIGNLEERPLQLPLDLPLELLHDVFEMLDFQSLLRFACASVRARTLVQTSLVYRNLIEYAQDALAALAFSRLISHHPAGTLRAALRSQNCFSCGHYGAWLLLASCQRCCWICASRNQSLWVLPRGVASKCFHIPLRQVDQLPGIFRLPVYAHGTSRIREPESFVSVASAKRLALAIHGSEEKIKDLQISTRLGDTKRELYAHYRAARLRPYDTDPLLISTTFNSINDPYKGNAHTSLPSIASGGVERGFLCRGCKWMDENYFPTHPTFHELRSLVPINLEPKQFLSNVQYRTRSREGSLHHMRMCYGVRRILAEDGLEHWLQELAHIPINQWA